MLESSGRPSMCVPWLVQIAQRWPTVKRAEQTTSASRVNKATRWSRLIVSPVSPCFEREPEACHWMPSRAKYVTRPPPPGYAKSQKQLSPRGCRCSTFVHISPLVVPKGIAAGMGGWALPAVYAGRERVKGPFMAHVWRFATQAYVWHTGDLRGSPLLQQA